MADLGFVAIGRNEGNRLLRCLKSALLYGGPVVYVDSGSSDGSVKLAQDLGVEVVKLDLSTPFTAARARNEGFKALHNTNGNLKFVQFLDGDCEVFPDWPAIGVKKLEEHPEIGVVAGRCRERYPNNSIYNGLCDLEWDTPVGEAKATGGNSMMRVDVFLAVGGFDPGIIAAEDDEICLRIRRLGHQIWRLDADMVVHDAAMYHFSQWWKRTVRCGYAYALGSAIHGQGPEKHFVQQKRRVLVWGFFLPLIVLLGLIPTHGWSLLLLLLYPLQVFRIYRQNLHRAKPGKALAFGLGCVLSKFPEFIGLCRFWRDRLLGRPVRIIEHK